MNILFISKLSGNLFAGPNNSVPAQIAAQKKYDNVFWYNLREAKRDEWIDIGCKNTNDYPSGRLADLPSPFDKPDLAVIEEVYCHPFSKIIKDLQNSNIPYIVIPRSQLTEKAQKKSESKKKIGNIMYFKSFIKKAAAVQYLSQQEREESEQQWKCRSVVIPNGAKLVQGIKKTHTGDGIKAVYIGRYEKYQKGLDLLIEALDKTQDLLRKNHFHLVMHGVDQMGTVEAMKTAIKEKNLTDIVEIREAVFGEEKTEALKAADIFVLTSRFEGMPMGLIEALAYGLPAIATYGTNMGKEIKAYNAGWVSETTVEGIADSLRSMIADYENADKFSKNAITLAEQYSWDRIAEFSHREYENVCKKEALNDYFV